MDFISFDIETIPGDFDALSESQQEYLLRGASTDEEKEKKKGEMALTALTGRVVCIGMAMYRIIDGKAEEIGKRSLSVVPEGFEKSEFIANSEKKEFILNDNEKFEYYETRLSDGTACSLAGEKEMLQMFWKKLEERKFPKLISFNGRGFDAPFLMHRSAIHRIKPPINLMDGTKFNYSNHVDLLDELTFYSPSSSGPTRRFNFDFYARAFGITSPKSEGVDGSKVSDLFSEGKIKEISEYCMRDVVATWELFLFWNEFLNFKRL